MWKSFSDDFPKKIHYLTFYPTLTVSFLSAESYLHTIPTQSSFFMTIFRSIFSNLLVENVHQKNLWALWIPLSNHCPFIVVIKKRRNNTAHWVGMRSKCKWVDFDFVFVHATGIVQKDWQSRRYGRVGVEEPNIGEKIGPLRNQTKSNTWTMPET